MKALSHITMLAVATAIGVGVLSSCSSDNDVVVPAITNNTLIGSEVEDASSEVSLSNLKTAGTRAAAGYNLDALGIPTTMPDAPSIPSDAVELTTDGSWGDHSGNYKVSAGKTLNFGNNSLNMSNIKLYVAGHVTISTMYGSPITIYVLKGGTLTLATQGESFLNNTGWDLTEHCTTVYNYGTIDLASNKTGLYVGSHEKLYNCGTIALRGLTFRNQGLFYTTEDMPAASSYKFEPGSKVNILGSFTCGDVSHFEGDIHVGSAMKVGGNFTITNCNFIADCALDVDGKVTINGSDNLYATYLHAGKGLEQMANTKIILGDKGLLDVTGTYYNHNNGQAAIVLSGANATAVVKADTIAFNSSSPSLGDVFFVQTPESGQLAGVDCHHFLYNDNTLVDTVDFKGGTVQIIYPETKNQFSIPADGCHGPGYNPNVTPNKPHLDVISEQEAKHTHDISATCVQYFNGNAYVSFHQRGNGQSGCLEVISTQNDQSQLKQFIRDHNQSCDFNHVMIDPAKRVLYTVGNNKNGGFMGWIDINSDGLLNTKDKIEQVETDSNTIEQKTYKPLQMIKLYQAATNAAKGHKETGNNSGDGNAVVLNGNTLQVASTYGLESYDATTKQNEYVRHTDGKAKHICVAPDGSIWASYFTRQSTDVTETLPLNIEHFAKADTNMTKPLLTIHANAGVAPNNGKNVIAVYDGKVYSCQGTYGLYVYDATSGALVQHYQEPKVVSTQGKDLKICANGVAVDAKYVYLAYGTRGLIVLDRSTLKEVTRYQLSRSANYVALANGYIYLAYGRNNLKVLKLVE